MRTILAGSRDLTRADLDRAMEACQWTSEITAVVSGGARGIDLAGEDWARDRSIAVVRYQADWNRLGKGAGFRRNIKMAKNADALVAVWDGKSRGTQHMIATARTHGLRLFVFIVTKETR
jgi:hypothetical protein